jgi:hypothetical protein
MVTNWRQKYPAPFYAPRHENENSLSPARHIAPRKVMLIIKLPLAIFPKKPLNFKGNFDLRYAKVQIRLF